LKNQANFLLKKFVCDFEPPSKSYRKNLETMFENIKENVPSNPSLKFVYNFFIGGSKSQKDLYR